MLRCMRGATRATTRITMGREARMMSVSDQDDLKAMMREAMRVTRNWKTSPNGSETDVCKSSMCLC